LLAPLEDSSCGPDPECIFGDGVFCVSDTVRGTCTGGRFEAGDCGFFGTTCDTETGVGRCTPHLDGVFVGSDFPGGVRVEVPLGGEVRGCLTSQNTGSWAWTPDLTRLGTSEPRDRASEHVGSDWLGPNRLAAIEAETARGSTGRFCFSLHGAASLGERVEIFSLVHEGHFWAADVGGVPDPVNRLTVVPVEADAVPHYGIGPDADPGMTADGGPWSEEDGGMPRSPMLGDGTVTGSCAVTSPAGRPPTSGLGWLAIVGAALFRRRRTRR
jgi:MYXO-CTERM domain-containing protein